MTNQPTCATLIERYLRTRGWRYFRGHREGEYFFVTNTRPRRLHVHFEVAPAHDDVLIIRVAPGCYFPAGERPWLTYFSDRWNRQERHVTAIVHASSDPHRIGVVTRKSQWIRKNIPFDDFASFVDRTVADATEFFTDLTPVVQLPSSQTPLLRHAG